MKAFAAAGAGFLLAVLWFDLMFDVQVLRQPAGRLPDEVLDSISAYYRRVTTQARPMNRLIALVMAATVATVVAELVRHVGPGWAGWLSLALVVAPVVLAGGRTVPHAVQLGSGVDDPDGLSRLARSVCRDHLFCVVAIAWLLVVQLT